MKTQDVATLGDVCMLVRATFDISSMEGNHICECVTQWCSARRVQSNQATTHGGYKLQSGRCIKYNSPVTNRQVSLSPVRSQTVVQNALMQQKWA